MEKRQEIRRFRRLSVRFWVRGEVKERVGYTVNISNGGMFLGANQVVPRGTRLRLEILDSQSGFVIEGVVARGVRVPQHLQSLQTQGMGIRFLPVPELVEELFVRKASPTPISNDAIEEFRDPEPGKTPPAAPPPGANQTPAPAASPNPLGFAPNNPARPQGLAFQRTFTLQFSSLDELRLIYQRDICRGGLFVSTTLPADIHQVVAIDIHPPPGSGYPVRLLARVVQRFDARRDGEANLLAGMGVELLDPAGADAAVRALLSRQ